MARHVENIYFQVAISHSHFCHTEINPDRRHVLEEEQSGKERGRESAWMKFELVQYVDDFGKTMI